MGVVLELVINCSFLHAMSLSTSWGFYVGFLLSFLLRISFHVIIVIRFVHSQGQSSFGFGAWLQQTKTSLAVGVFVCMLFNLEAHSLLTSRVLSLVSFCAPLNAQVRSSLRWSTLALSLFVNPLQIIIISIAAPEVLLRPSDASLASLAAAQLTANAWGLVFGLSSALASVMCPKPVSKVNQGQSQMSEPFLGTIVQGQPVIEEPADHDDAVQVTPTDLELRLGRIAMDLQMGNIGVESASELRAAALAEFMTGNADDDATADESMPMGEVVGIAPVVTGGKSFAA
jgi:hypothetical protein